MLSGSLPTTLSSAITIAISNEGAIPMRRRRGEAPAQHRDLTLAGRRIVEDVEDGAPNLSFPGERILCSYLWKTEQAKQSNYG